MKLRKATQVNLDKTFGGVRPLTMLEESLKAIEGHVASRKNQARQQRPTGTVYPPSKISSEIKHRAVGQVLEINALVCEDSIKHKKTLCRSPTDYEKFFNIIERASAEAAKECMGVPIGARSTTADAFDQPEVTLETRLGITQAIIPDRGSV